MNIIIIGATGVVGEEIINCLAEKNFPISTLHLVASARSAGESIKTKFGRIKLLKLNEGIFKGMDIALFAADNEISANWAPLAASQGCLVIDNSSYFRYQPDVPLIIPEINPQAAFRHKGIIANPNCTTALAAVPLWILEQNYGLKKIIISTYQAASGAGRLAMEELKQQTKEYAAGKHLTIENFKHQILFNLIPQIDIFLDNGYTKEEMKVVWETRKIFSRPRLDISCTAVRVPILRAHSESIIVETNRPVDPAQVRELFASTKGIEVVDDPSSFVYPMPLNASKKFPVQVGRIRKNLIFANHGLEFFISGDQLLKGAALNAVQIAELFIK